MGWHRNPEVHKTIKGCSFLFFFFSFLVCVCVRVEVALFLWGCWGGRCWNKLLKYWDIAKKEDMISNLLYIRWERVWNDRDVVLPTTVNTTDNAYEKRGSFKETKNYKLLLTIGADISSIHNEKRKLGEFNTHRESWRQEKAETTNQLLDEFAWIESTIKDTKSKWDGKRARLT